jgi:hypothetical protein
MKIKELINNTKQLVWNDPDPIKGNDYKVTYIEPINEDFDEDTPILIQYGGGSEAQVFASELSILK